MPPCICELNRVKYLAVEPELVSNTLLSFHQVTLLGIDDSYTQGSSGLLPTIVFKIALGVVTRGASKIRMRDHKKNPSHHIYENEFHFYKYFVNKKEMVIKCFYDGKHLHLILMVTFVIPGTPSIPSSAIH